MSNPASHPECKTRASIARLLRPESIAVIGASATPGKHGNTIVRNLLRWDYAGRIFPVNPSGGTVEGLECYASIADVPESIDCAYMIIPASAIPETARDAARAGVRTIIVGANGFAESGTARGRERQDVLTEVARSTGVRILGPNTNGILNTNDRVAMGYNTSHGDVATAGNISMASHSGAFLNGIARGLARYGASLGKFIPVGNEVDFDLLDFFDFLVEDEDSNVIGLVIEGLSDTTRFRAIAERARQRGKPVIALKVGRTAIGAQSTLAHATRLAGSARAFEALFREAGVASVRSLDALIGGCALLAHRGPMAPESDRRLICVSSSGAGGTQLADLATEHGIALAGDREGNWEEAITAGLAAVPEIGKLRNPIDTSTLRGDWGRLADVLHVLQDAGLDGPVVVFTHVASRQKMDERLARALIKRRAETQTPVAVVAPGGLSPEIEALYAANKIPLFNDLMTLFASLQCHYVTTTPGSPLSGPARPMPKGTPALDDAVTRARLAHDGPMLNEMASADILRAAGVPMVPSTEVSSLAAAKSAAQSLGYPVVLKALAPGVAHKAKAGLVETGIGDAATLDAAYNSLAARIAYLGCNFSDVPIILQPMVRSQAELFAGLTWEPPLGHFLIFGLGGVHTEILDQVTLIPTGVDELTLRQRVEESIAGRIAVAAAGKDGGDLIASLVGVLSALDRLAAWHGNVLESVDVNPLLVTNSGCLAVDALVTLHPPSNIGNT